MDTRSPEIRAKADPPPDSIGKPLGQNFGASAALDGNQPLLREVLEGLTHRMPVDAKQVRKDGRGGQKAPDRMFSGPDILF